MCIGTTSVGAILASDVAGKPGWVEQCHHFFRRYLRGLPQPEGLCATLAGGIKDCDEFYGSTNPRTGSFIVMSWLAGMDMFCERQRFTQELPSQFASNRSRDQHTEWSVEKLPFYVRTLNGVPNAYMVPIFKSSHDVEVPFNNWISAIPDLS